MEIKTMVYNIFSGRNFLKCRELDVWTDACVIDISLAAHTIKKYTPDIVGLCEVQDEGDIFTKQTDDIAKICGYPYFFFSPAIPNNRGGHYGVALLSKYPILKAETHMIPDPVHLDEGRYETRCIAKITLDANGQNIDIFVSHFGLEENERVNAVKLAEELIEKSENPCILMGDFNCRPDSVYIMQLSKLLQNTSDGQEIFTHSSIEPNRQLDYIFADKAFKVNSHGALDETASDHKPYYANLELR